MTKITSVFLVLSILAMANVVMSNSINPRKDSFFPRGYTGYSEPEMALIIYWAEEARKRHGSGNRFMIAVELVTNLDNEFGLFNHCMVSNDGNADVEYMFDTYSFSLKSETNDNMGIICWRMPRSGRYYDLYKADPSVLEVKGKE